MRNFLTRTECTAMRGIAIMAIMLHNYCHWLKGIARENEYTFLERKAQALLQAVTQPDDLLPLHLLSFFGHYGVPVFLFLSGFGLVMKYEDESARRVGVWPFVRYNYLKLLRILVVGFVLFVLVDAVTPGMHRFRWHEVVAILGMYANFYEDPSHVVWPGPYWYFSVTLQLYLLYRLVLYRRRSWLVVVLVALCWLWQAWCLDDAVTMERLRYSLVGGMLPFGLGMLAARCGKTDALRNRLGAVIDRLGGPLVSAVVLLLSVVFTCWFSLLSPHAWLWIPVFIVAGTVSLVRLSPAWVRYALVWIGSLSAAIFVVHPTVRKIFIRPYMHDDVYTGLLLYVVTTLCLSWLVKQLINRIPMPRL